MKTRQVDPEQLRERLGGRCFICEFLAGNPEFAHELVYEDEFSVAFLNKYPALYGVTSRVGSRRVLGT